MLQSEFNAVYQKWLNYAHKEYDYLSRAKKVQARRHFTDNIENGGQVQKIEDANTKTNSNGDTIGHYMDPKSLT